MADKALVIDDDADSSAIFGEALREAGFDTEVISSGDKALERLSVTQPQVIVLDLFLPRVSGMELLRYIRQDPRLASAYVIIISAAAPAVEQAGDLPYKPDLALAKPISFAYLRTLAQQLARREQP